MALERINTTAYQNNVGSASKSRETAVRKNDDSTSDSVGGNSSYKTQSVDEYTAEQKEINEKYIKEEIARANNFLKRHNIRCVFDYHEETNRITIKVMDGETKEVLREIPPEKTLDAIQKIWELAGLLIDERS